MSAAQRRVFRIEQNRRGKPNGSAQGGGPTAFAPSSSDLRHREIMAMLHEIRDRVEPEEQLTQQIIEDYKHDLHEARKIKDELNRIYTAISRTKQEIAALRQSGDRGLKLSRRTDELGAIVEGTEQATETILHAAEEIDTKATDLIATLKVQANKNDACDIQELVVMIFEACNFQDLTGQRITKVVNAFRFIEERVERMMEIWGGIESFKDVEPVDIPRPEGDQALLNGPALESDEDVASQDDIDALFD
jgi:chemotaxis protein CheZ